MMALLMMKITVPIIQMVQISVRVFMALISAKPVQVTISVEKMGSVA
jgi:hypothetical protein